MTALALALTTLSGCATTGKRLAAAAAAQGQARAAVILPDLPDTCRELMGLVEPREGEKWRAVQLRWEAVRINQNDRTAACTAFYDDLKTRLKQ